MSKSVNPRVALCTFTAVLVVGRNEKRRFHVGNLAAREPMECWVEREKSSAAWPGSQFQNRCTNCAGNERLEDSCRAWSGEGPLLHSAFQGPDLVHQQRQGASAGDRRDHVHVHAAELSGAPVCSAHSSA